MENLVTAMSINITDGLIIIFMLILLSLILSLYLYNSLATYHIAKKTNTKKAWFAFLPYMNIWLWHSLSEKPRKYFIIYVLLPYVTIFFTSGFLGLFLLPLIFFAGTFIDCAWNGSIAIKRGYMQNTGIIRALSKNISILMLVLGSLLIFGSVVGEFPDQYDQETLNVIERNSKIGSILFYAGIFLYIVNLVLLGIIAWHDPKQKHTVKQII
jgi:hypothetical protein